MGCHGGPCCCTRKCAYVFGLVLLFVGIAISVSGVFFMAWVNRKGGTTLTADTVEYYGLWQTCSPDQFDVCQHIFDGFPEVAGAARGSQALLTMSFAFIVICFAVEAVSCFTCFGSLKKKLSVLFDNHIIEFITAVGTVMGFMGMLVFAAEVKNKAERAIGQEDQTAWGFGFSLAGQLSCVLGACLVACGRQPHGGTTA